MTVIAKIAMVLSFFYFAGMLVLLWLGQMLGWHNEVWDLYDLPRQANSPPIWTLTTGFLFSAFTMFSLGKAYLATWTILNGGPGQDFRQLARCMRRLGWGLIGFWAGFNLIAVAMLYLLAIDLEPTEDFDLFWEPFDLDVIIGITGMVLLAVAQTLNRAWQAEDENSQFL